MSDTRICGIRFGKQPSSHLKYVANSITLTERSNTLYTDKLLDWSASVSETGSNEYAGMLFDCFDLPHNELLAIVFKNTHPEFDGEFHISEIAFVTDMYRHEINLEILDNSC